jgi:hypothetical protein
VTRPNSPSNFSSRTRQNTCLPSSTGATVVETPALKLVRALARHQAWLDLRGTKPPQNLIDPSLLTPID